MLLRHLDNVILFANDTYLENTLYQHEISNRFTWNNWKERALQAIRARPAPMPDTTAQVTASLRSVFSLCLSLDAG